MHGSKLSFQRRLRNASPSVLAFYSMNMRCGCAPVFAQTPTYFHGNPEHARARGTNSRENAWWIVREARLWKISMWWYALNSLLRCAMQFGNGVVSVSIYSGLFRWKSRVFPRRRKISDLWRTHHSYVIANTKADPEMLAALQFNYFIL